MVDKKKMNTSLTGTINKYGCQSFQGKNIIDKEQAMACTLPTFLKKSNPISIMTVMLRTILPV